MSLTSCFNANDNQIKAISSFGACGAGNSSSPFVPCCANGHTCLGNGFCQYSSPLSTGTGIYLGGCTDPSFKDPSCPNYCESLAESEVVYLNGSWQCCGMVNGAPTCNSPAGPSFAGPDPNSLQKIAVVVGGTTPTGFSMYPSGVPAVTSAASIVASGPISSITASAQPTTQSIPSSSSIAVASATAAAAPASSTSSSNAGKDGMSQSAMIGVIAGSVCGAILLGILIYLVFLVRFSIIRNGKGAQNIEEAQWPAASSAEPAYPTLLPPAGHDFASYRSKSFASASTLGPPSASLSMHKPWPPEYQSPLSRPYDAFARVGSSYSQSRSLSLSPGRPYVIHELSGASSGYGIRPPSDTPPAELMAEAGREDRMAGGGPDKALPQLPPEARQEDNTPGPTPTRQFSVTDRYEHLLANH